MAFERAGTLAVLVLTLACRVAAAEPSAADKETARSLLNEGDRKRNAGDARGALSAYRAADAIMGVPTTGIEVSKAEERLGLLVESRDTALRVARFPASAAEPRAFKLARASAERIASELSVRIPSVHAVVRGAPLGEVTVQFDGAAIPKAAAQMPRKVNPGKHVIVAYADGYERSTAELLIEERETRECELTLFPSKEPRQVTPRSAPLGAKDDGAVVATVTDRLAAGDQASTASRTSPLVYVGGSLAVAGIVVGTVAGIAELIQTAKARTACTSVPPNPTACNSLYDNAHRLATVSNVSLGIGAALGAATAMFALSRPAPKVHGVPSRASLYLRIEPSAAIIEGTF